jgi:hypothetical protein
MEHEFRSNPTFKKYTVEYAKHCQRKEKGFVDFLKNVNLERKKENVKN